MVLLYVWRKILKGADPEGETYIFEGGALTGLLLKVKTLTLRTGQGFWHRVVKPGVIQYKRHLFFSLSLEKISKKKGMSLLIKTHYFLTFQPSLVNLRTAWSVPEIFLTCRFLTTTPGKKQGRSQKEKKYFHGVIPAGIMVF